MGAKLQVPRHSYNRLRQLADKFLSEHNPSGRIPVPIEDIAEFSLGLDIVPIPGLQTSFEIEGFIHSDFSGITVDQFVLENRVTRYRFTLAHEIGHFYLHRTIFEKLKFKTIRDWMKFLKEVDPEDYSWLEWQANAFAGLILVPATQLKNGFQACVASAKQERFSPRSEATLYYIAEKLAGIFGVSREVVEIRMAKDRT